MKAKYFDPITKLPYRNLQAFKIIREAYFQQLEEKGNTENPNVLEWLQWRKKVMIDFIWSICLWYNLLKINFRPKNNEIKPSKVEVSKYKNKLY